MSTETGNYDPVSDDGTSDNSGQRSALGMYELAREMGQRGLGVTDNDTEDDLRAALKYSDETRMHSVRVPDHVWNLAAARAHTDKTSVSAVIVAALDRYGHGDVPYFVAWRDVETGTAHVETYDTEREAVSAYASAELYENIEALFVDPRIDRSKFRN